MSEGEKGFSRARLEAFSDGVIAVIITIMVLELKAPESADLGDLLKLWPSFLSYLISFVYVAIYWINHHKLLGFARAVTPGMIWANNLLLFCLSLFPFATAYMAATHLSPVPTMVYGALQLLCGKSFEILSGRIHGQFGGERGESAALKALARKALVARLCYAAAILVAYFLPPLAVAIYAAIALAWVAPGLFAGPREAA